MARFTWDDLYKMAEDKACGSPELKAKDNARFALQEIIMVDTGEMIEEMENPEEGIDEYLEDFKVFFDEDGNVQCLNLKEFLKMKPGVVVGCGIAIRDHIICTDGFAMSVQASAAHYCQPRKLLNDGEYFTAEIGFPNMKEQLIIEFAEDRWNPTSTVYPFVPIEIAEKVVEKHGGISRMEIMKV